MIRRWIEGQTFAPRAGTSGIQVLDAQAARYGEFDEIFLVGLVEGEWPQRPSKSIFYPPSLLSQLDWPDSRVALAGERAAFQDLLQLPRRQVRLSTFELENDAIVAPSVFLEDVERAGLRQVDPPLHDTGRMFVSEGLATEPVAHDAVTGDASAWLSCARAGRNSPAVVFMVLRLRICRLVTPSARWNAIWSVPSDFSPSASSSSRKTRKTRRR